MHSAARHLSTAPDPVSSPAPGGTIEALRTALGRRFPGVVVGLAGAPTESPRGHNAADELRDGAITEFVGQPGDGGTTRLIQGVAKVLERRPQRYGLWLDLEGTFYPPGAAQLGIPLERLLLVRTADLLTGLAAVELALRGGAVCVAAVDIPARVPPLRLALYHRLRRRVRESGAVLVFLARQPVVPADRRHTLGTADEQAARG